MKQKLIVIIILLNILFHSKSLLFAQKRNDTAIGKIDIYAVLLLHPAMIEFNPEIRAFHIKRDQVSKQKAASEQQTKIKEREKLEKDLKRIRSRMTEEDNRYLKKIDELNKKHIAKLIGLATESAVIEQIEYKQTIEKEDNSHYSKMTNMLGEYNLIEEQLAKLNELNFVDGYTTPDETIKRFEAILNETKSYIKRVADSKGISIVLNSGYKKLLKNLTLSKNDYISENQSLGSIFKTPFQKELQNDNLAIKGYYEGINMRTKFWLNNAGNFLNINNNSLLDSDIILGGQDLTIEVLSSLYKAYKLDSNISNAIIQNAISY